MTGVLMSSYLGTQAQAVGLKRNYGGILGRADRLVLLMVFGAVEVVVPSPVPGSSGARVAAGDLWCVRSCDGGSAVCERLA